MKVQLAHILQSLFHTTELDDVPVHRLQETLREHPYFGAVHFLLAQRLRHQDPEHFNVQVQKAAVYFHDPLWMHWQLSQQDTLAAPGVEVKPEPAALAVPAMQEVEDEEDDDYIPVMGESVRDEVQGLGTADIKEAEDRIGETDEADRDLAQSDYVETGLQEMDSQETDLQETGLQETGLQHTDSQDTGLENTDSGDTDFKGSDLPDTELNETDSQQTFVPDTGFHEPDTEESESDTSLAETGLQQTDVENAIVSSRSYSDQTVSSNSYTKASGTESYTEQPAHSEASDSNESYSDKDISSETYTDHTVSSGSYPETSGTTDSYTEQPAHSEASGITGTYSEESGSKATDTSPAAESGIPTAQSPQAAHTPGTPNDTKQPAFDPYYTIDYFAYQGIKAPTEVLPGDKLGKQLKSFTEWLKTMKRLPQVKADTLTNDHEQQDIQRFAAGSLEKKEVVTEAMAEVLIKQDKKREAIAIYEKLSLLDPSKSALFAAKIENLKSELI